MRQQLCGRLAARTPGPRRSATASVGRAGPVRSVAVGVRHEAARSGPGRRPRWPWPVQAARL